LKATHNKLERKADSFLLYQVLWVLSNAGLSWSNRILNLTQTYFNQYKHILLIDNKHKFMDYHEWKNIHLCHRKSDNKYDFKVLYRQSIKPLISYWISLRRLAIFKSADTFCF